MYSYDESTDSVWVSSSGQLMQLPVDAQAWIGRTCQIATRQLADDEWSRFVPGGDAQPPTCS